MITRLRAALALALAMLADYDTAGADAVLDTLKPGDLSGVMCESCWSIDGHAVGCAKVGP